MILHKPVLLQEVLDFMPPNPKLIVDGTLGHWGHSLEMIKKLTNGWVLIGLDLDNKILEKTKLIVINLTSFTCPGTAGKTETVATPKKNDHAFHFSRPFWILFGAMPKSIAPQEEKTNGGNTIYWVNDSYANITTILNWKKADYILLDLWVNLEHFKDGSRGFSIKENADLDMRFDQNAKQSAYDIVNQYKLQDLSNIFINYGDFTQKKAKELAEAILRERSKQNIKTTFDFKKILNDCGLGDKACAVIFQCLRIETNKEIQNLRSFLQQLPQVLNANWRCAIMSYHSIEDRLVKISFKQLEETKQFTILTSKTVQPHYTEVQKNKAARSAKLRVIEYNS